MKSRRAKASRVSSPDSDNKSLLRDRDSQAPPPLASSGRLLETAAFILAFGFAPLGFVLSLVAIARRRKSPNPGDPTAQYPVVSLLISLAMMAFLVVLVWGAIESAREEGNDERRRRDIDLVVEAIDGYRSMHQADPQSWSDLEGLIGGSLEYYKDGPASINPANASQPNGNAPGVFPPGPESPSRGNPAVFGHPTLVIWRQAKCTTHESGSDWRGQVVAGDPGQMALLYRPEVNPVPLSVCLEV